MSAWVMTLLVGFLLFALAGLAVLLIWLWHEPEGQQTQRRRPQRQAPKIVIRPRLFRTKEIADQSRLPRPLPPPAPRPASASTPPPTPATPRTAPTPVTRATPPPATPRTTPTPAAPQRTTRPPATRATPPPATPTPAPAAQRTVQPATAEPVVTSTNGPKIENPRFKVDFDTVHKRTGQAFRDCGCRECREMKADAGI